MTKIRRKISSALLSGLMAFSLMAAPVTMNNSGLTETPGIVQSITADAATLYAPGIAKGKYIATFCQKKVTVYTSTNRKTQGSADSMNGKTIARTAYASNGDEIYIYTLTNTYCYISYPVNNGRSRRYGYINTTDVFPLNWTAGKVTSKVKASTYTKSDLKSTSKNYYIAKGDAVYTLGKMNNNYLLLYPIANNNWRAGWVSESTARTIGVPVPSSPVNYRWLGWVWTTSQPLSLRKTASANAQVLVNIPRGAQIRVLENRKTNGFLKVTYGNKTGYVTASYVLPFKLPTVYSQTDSRWSNHQYGYSDSARRNKATIGSSGCGILSYVNAVYYLTGKYINPITLADWSVRYGYRINGVGTSGNLYSAFAKSQGKNYGFAYDGSSSKYSDLRTHLQAGQVAIGSAPGHLMAIVAYDSFTGKYLILDSYKSSNRGTYQTGYVWKTEKECINNSKLKFSTFYFIKKV